MRENRAMLFGEFLEADGAGIDSFYKNCQKAVRPAIWIKKRRTLADVFWDLETLPLELVYNIFGDGPQSPALDHLLKRFDDVTGRRFYFSGSIITGWIRDVPIESARWGAEMIAHLLEQELRWAREREANAG